MKSGKQAAASSMHVHFRPPGRTQVTSRQVILRSQPFRRKPPSDEPADHKSPLNATLPVTPTDSSAVAPRRKCRFDRQGERESLPDTSTPVILSALIGRAQLAAASTGVTFDTKVGHESLLDRRHVAFKIGNTVRCSLTASRLSPAKPSALHFSADRPLSF